MDAELIAAQILRARAARTCLDARTLPIDDHVAYAVQHLMTQHRQRAGERQVGWKLGYTSDAMREQMRIASPNLGPLTDAMMVADGGLLPAAMQPRVEPEIALVLGRDVDSALDPTEWRDAVAEARVALEVVDSVWCDYRFTWAHNTADGSSAAFVVLGDAVAEPAVSEVLVTLERNGEPVGSGRGAAAMGDPYAALAWLTGQLAGRPRALRRGDIVITGGLCAAVRLEPGDVVTARAGTASATVRR